MRAPALLAVAFGLSLAACERAPSPVIGISPPRAESPAPRDAGTDARPPDERLLALLARDPAGAGPARVDEVARELRAMRPLASAEETMIIDRFLAVADVLLRDGGPPTGAELREATMGLVETDRMLAALYPGSFEARWLFGRELLSAIWNAPVLGLDPAPLRQEAEEVVPALVGAFPGEARAHELSAALCEETLPDTTREESARELVGCMRELVRCTRLEPSRASCREAYARDLAEYDRPLCAGADVRGDLHLRVARPAPPPTGPRAAVIAAGRALYLEPDDVLAPGDVVSVEETSVTSGDGALRPASTLEIAPAKREALAEAAERASSSGGALAWLVGPRVLLAARPPPGRILDGPTVSIDVPIELLCLETEQRALPPDLPRVP